MIGHATDGAVSLEMSVPEYAVLGGMLGLAVSVMQRDYEACTAFVESLSTPYAEQVAKLFVDGFAEITRGYKAETAPNGLVQ